MEAVRTIRSPAPNVPARCPELDAGRGPPGSHFRNASPGHLYTQFSRFAGFSPPVSPAPGGSVVGQVVGAWQREILPGAGRTSASAEPLGACPTPETLARTQAGSSTRPNSPDERSRLPLRGADGSGRSVCV